jgi:hypothetical protein
MRAEKLPPRAPWLIQGLVDQVKDIRDKAEAMAAYARQAKDTELIQYATEIKVRAERRCGELLSHMEKRDGGDAMKARSNPSTEVPPTLADIGLTRDQSSRYQQLAAMPDDHFETAVATAKATAGAGLWITRRPEPVCGKNCGIIPATC